MKLSSVKDYNNPRSVASRLREQRWQLFVRCFGDLAQLHVIDLGGVVRAWLNRTPAPASVTLVNLTAARAKIDRFGLPDHVRFVQWDVRDAPPPEISGATFDLVHSNSLIEHLGGCSHRERFATTVQQLADRYWVQTPDRKFPIEPHWLFPGFQFLPLPAKAAVSRWWPLSNIRSPDWATACRHATGVELITAHELRSLFPAGEIISERTLGLSRSLIAVRCAPDRSGGPTNGSS